jgi:hypothetical protein
VKERVLNNAAAGIIKRGFLPGIPVEYRFEATTMFIRVAEAGKPGFQLRKNEGAAGA